MATLAPDAPRNSGHRGAIAIIGLLFFVFGFVTWLNGSLIPFLKIICHLTTMEALLVTFAFYIAYTVMALPMSAILSRVGYRNGMALGLGIMAIGALIHIPAAWLASFPIFLLGLFTLGTGLTILQTAANPYIVLLGPIESAATRISLMGIVNKGAGVVVPLVFASLVLSDLGDPHALAQNSVTPEFAAALATRLVIPYLAMAAVLAALVGLVRFAPLPEIEPDTGESIEEGRDSVLQFPHLILGAIAIFAGMGLEVLAGDTIGLFGQSLGMPHFAVLTSFTMCFMVLGYIVGVLLIPRVIGQRRALASCSLFGLAATTGAIVADRGSASISETLWGWTGLMVIPNAIFFVALMGLANALVWPTVWPLALRGLGRFTARGSALLIMAIAGGALIPPMFGLLAGALGDMQPAYVIAAPCYAFLLFYAVKGSQLRRW